MNKEAVLQELEFEVEEVPEPEEEVQPEIEEPAAGDPAAPPTGGVSVSINEVAPPGAVISGSVTFSDGQNGRWLIDQEGSLSVDPDTTGYQPSEPDIAEFQEKLRAAVEGQA